MVKFSSTRRELTWKDNVVAVGNASAFVEPLEATALNNLALQVKLLIQVLQHSEGEPTPSMVDVYNLRFENWWDDTRDFLALHYKFNTLLDTPFWKTCREESDLGLLGEFVDFYRKNAERRCVSTRSRTAARFTVSRTSRRSCRLQGAVRQTRGMGEPMKKNAGAN